MDTVEHGKEENGDGANLDQVVLLSGAPGRGGVVSEPLPVSKTALVKNELMSPMSGDRCQIKERVAVEFFVRENAATQPPF